MSSIQAAGGDSVPDLRLQRGPHVFVSGLDSLELAGDDRHHLAHVLRLRTGDPLTVSDGDGRWRSAVFGDTLEATSEVHDVAPPAYDLGLGIALTKAAKPEFAVQKATELGIDEIIVFQATHSVARWDSSKQTKSVPRLEKVAREAAMQSRRVRIPSVAFADDLASVVSSRNVVRADFGGIPTNSSHRLVLVGPEGGWSDAERALVPETVDLGPGVLRAETAAVVASAFLVQSRGHSA